VRGNTLQQKIERLEDLLFADLQTYLGAMNSTPNQHQDQIKSLMETLEHLLQRHLEGCEGWNSSCFIDGIVPAFDMLPDEQALLLHRNTVKPAMSALCERAAGKSDAGRERH